MVDTSRLLKSAFIIPLSLSLALAPAWGFDISDTGETPRTTPVDTASTTADLNDDATPAHELADSAAIIIDGTPQSNDEAAVLINSNGQSVLINGDITIRDRTDDGDASTIDLENAIGIKTTVVLPAGIDLRLGSGASIAIDEIRGPNYDGDRNGVPDANDDDEDGIIEGSSAIGTFNRIGLWIAATGGASTIAGSIIGEAGSSIRVDGNGARGVQIDQALGGDFDFSTTISNLQSGGILGDNSVGVDINADIGGYYRQRGIIDVRGENSVGIDIDANIGGALLVETGVNATGYSTTPSGSPGGPQRGGANFSNDDFDEFSDRQRAANPQERRQSRAAIDISSAIAQGVIINGPVNRIGTTAEADEFTCLVENEDCDADGIFEQRRDGIDVTGLKTQPFHFDENRPRFNANGATASGAYLTSYGESEATLLIVGNIGTANGATRETFLDITDDDNDDDPNVADDVADLYDSDAEFFFSHGLMNRNWIEANGFYDSVDNGDGYSIIRPATALKLNDDTATIHGGIFNSGIISALAYNADATAVNLLDGALTDGHRNNDAVFLNEGVIQALIASHTRSHVGITASSNAATAVKISNSVDFEDSLGAAIDTPVFINAGTVSAASTHTQLNTATEVGDDYETVSGDNAIAFDLSAIGSDFNLTQRMRQADSTLAANVDGNAGDETVYSGSGDLDIDRNGDGVIDTRDFTAPLIRGDVNFGAGDNDFAISAGSVFGNISFGNGDDTLILTNTILDDADDEYTAPTTSVTGRITNGDAGSLDISIGERTRLHLVGQEGDSETETENLAVNSLTLNGELLVVVDQEQLSADTPLLTVTDLTVGNAATITPRLTGLPEDPNEETTVDIISYGNQVTLPSTILNNDTPFIYDVALSDENATISANFSLKSVAELQLNQTEGAALNAVLAHFRGDENLEATITGIDNGDDFKAAYRQLLPHYSDGTAQQLSGLADMATGAVSQHLQLINAGGRRGGDGWVQQFGDYRKQDADMNGATVSGTSYAIALGYDLPVSAIDALGLYLQMGFSAVNEKSAVTNEIKGDGISYGAYLSDKIGPLQYELNATYGFVGLESDRLVNFAGLVDRMTASWDATSTAASARLAYPILQDAHLLRLEAGTDFFRLEHDDYSESETVGRGFAMHVKGGESEKTSQFIGLRGGYRRGGDDPVAIVWEPNYYLGWRTTSDTSPYEATANFVGTDESFNLKSFIEPEDAIDLGFGLAAHNDYFAFEFNYRARIADDEETHGGGVSVRVLF